MLFFRHRWSRFELRRPRNPLLRVGVALLGVALLALLLVFGLVIGLGMLAFAGIRHLLGLGAGARRRPGRQDADADVLEGEYNVVRKPVDQLIHR
ncbi:MAG: hypothetical protein ACXIUZ_14330 [Lysobacteraceae bacterium]